MKTAFLVMAAAMISTPAFADGFVCKSERDGLVVKVYNHTQPEVGTRTGAVMILSDSTISAGNKTIARFTDANGTLDSRSSVFAAKVDHRFNDSGRKGELLGGTKIGYLKQIVLDVDFSYARPVASGAQMRGDLFLVKRNGEEVRIDLACARYLKN